MLYVRRILDENRFIDGFKNAFSVGNGINEIVVEVREVGDGRQKRQE